MDGSGQRVDCEATALSRAKEDGSRAVAVQLMDVHGNVVRCFAQSTGVHYMMYDIKLARVRGCSVKHPTSESQIMEGSTVLGQ